MEKRLQVWAQYSFCYGSQSPRRELDALLIGIMHASVRDWILVSLSLGIIVCHRLDMTIAVDWDAKPQTNQSKSLSVNVAPPCLIHLSENHDHLYNIDPGNLFSI